MNKYNTTLYVGVTNNLSARLYEHFTKQNRGSFSAKYNLNKLVYYEAFESIIHAIEREKYVKGKSRSWRIQLIKSMNPLMRDLSGEWLYLN